MAIQRVYVKCREEKHKETVYYLEGNIDMQKFLPLFVNPLIETWTLHTQLEETDGPIFEIRYKKAVTDPELQSLFAAAEALGENGLQWGRVGKRYQFPDSSEEKAQTFMEQNLFNPIVQEIVDPNEALLTLRPRGEPDPVTSVSLLQCSDEELLRVSEEHSWNAPLAQLKAIRRYEQKRKRPLKDAEIELIVTAWSDHCFHTTWKGLGLLERLKAATKKINHPLVVSAFDDNAGGIDFDGEFVIIIKGETHNHPASIAPYGGVATKHGGVIRDVIGFGKGGYPIGGTTIMGTCPKGREPEGALDPERIVRESVEATAGYCNPMGIPILHALYKEHAGYAKCLALGHSIGIIPKKYAIKEDPRPGDIALLIGGRTGRDGIHGATASSGLLTSKSKEKDFASVQIGDPITERKIMAAAPYIRDEDCVRTITDLGAGGMGLAAAEIGAKTGVALNLNNVPLKDETLSAREVLLSESQERMLLVIPPEKIRKTKKILRAYGVEYAQIGKFTNRKKFEAYSQGRKVVDLSMDFLWNECPIEQLPVERPRTTSLPVAAFGEKNPADALLQFDKTVQGRTVLEPLNEQGAPSYVSLLAPTRGTRGIVTAISFHPERAYLHPREYVCITFHDVRSRVIKAGADPKNIFLCSNFYTPKPTPQGNWRLKEMVECLAELTEEYKTPVITGKDSSSGTFVTRDGKKVEVPPTFVLFALGIVPDIRKVKNTHFASPAFRACAIRKNSAHVGVLYAPGTNCHEETIYALNDALGVKASLVLIDSKGNPSIPLRKFTALIIPGGFSYGDHFGAGRVFALLLKQRLIEELREFTAQKKRILGICNGFQALTEAGLLAGALVQNASGKFESRWVRVSASATASQKQIFSLPVAHGEGRLVLAPNAPYQPAFFYVDEQNAPTMKYPQNPAGSSFAIAGLSDRTGYILGMMPHPERATLPYHKSQDGLIVFKGLVS